MSSHVLSEVERLVSHVGIIARGQLRFQGRLDDLVGQAGGEPHVALRTSDDRRALALLGRDGGARLDGARLLVPANSAAQTAGIVRCLVLAGIDVHEVVPCARDLERVFLDLVAA